MTNKSKFDESPCRDNPPHDCFYTQDELGKMGRKVNLGAKSSCRQCFHRYGCTLKVTLPSINPNFKYLYLKGGKIATRDGKIVGTVQPEV